MQLVGSTVPDTCGSFLGVRGRAHLPNWTGETVPARDVLGAAPSSTRNETSTVVQREPLLIGTSKGTPPERQVGRRWCDSGVPSSARNRIGGLRSLEGCSSFLAGAFRLRLGPARRGRPGLRGAPGVRSSPQALRSSQVPTLPSGHCPVHGAGQVDGWFFVTQRRAPVLARC